MQNQLRTPSSFTPTTPKQRTNGSLTDSMPTTADIQRNDTHSSYSSHSVTTATNTDIAQKTAMAKQDAENAAKRSTLPKNARAPPISAANATKNTKHGTIIAQLELLKCRDSRRSGAIPHQFTVLLELMNQ